MSKPSQPSPPPVLGVAEIALNVADLPRMRAFYASTLGFSLIAESSHPAEDCADSDEPTISFLQIQPTSTPLGRHRHPLLLVLIDHRRHSFARRDFDGLEPSTSTLNHLAFEIDPGSFDEYRAHLRFHGLATHSTRFPAFRARALFFDDPEGNTVELIAHDPEASA